MTLDGAAMEALLAWFSEAPERAFVCTHENGRVVVRLRVGESARGIEASGATLAPVVVAALDAWTKWARLHLAG